MEEDFAFNGRPKYGIRSGNIYVASFYDRDKKKPFIVRTEGPYDWTLLLYRTFHNKIELYVSNDQMDELRADDLLHAIIKKTKNDPKLRVGRMVPDQGWSKLAKKDVEAFPQVVKNLEELVSFELIS
jgi:hypothetical protein